MALNEKYCVSKCFLTFVFYQTCDMKNELKQFLPLAIYITS